MRWQDRAGERIAHAYDYLIEPSYQRRGYGAEALEALEADVASRGLSGIALHVGHNEVARALYANLDYRPTSISVFEEVAGKNA